MLGFAKPVYLQPLLGRACVGFDWAYSIESALFTGSLFWLIRLLSEQKKLALGILDPSRSIIRISIAPLSLDRRQQAGKIYYMPWADFLLLFIGYCPLGKFNSLYSLTISMGLLYVTSPSFLPPARYQSPFLLFEGRSVSVLSPISVIVRVSCASPRLTRISG